VVVVDEHVLAVLVHLEAAQAEAGHLTHPASRADKQLVDEHGDVTGVLAERSEGGHPRWSRGPGDGGEQIEGCVELGDDASGQGPAWWLVGNSGAAVAAAERECRPERVDQPELACFAQHQGALLDHGRFGFGAEGLLPGREARGTHPGQEPFHVGASEHGRVFAAAGPGGQDRREHPDRPDAMRQGAVAYPADSGRRPSLGRLAQPGLADSGEVEVASSRDPEEAQIPDVVGLLDLRVRVGETDPVDAEASEAHVVAVPDAVQPGQVELGQRGDASSA
jgi:hypothetical protein